METPSRRRPTRERKWLPRLPGAGGIDLDRQPEFGRVQLAGREGKSRRHDADHEAGIAIEANVAADDPAIAAERPLP